MAETAGTMEWRALLAETRQALSTLRADDLEELAARAQIMFDMAASGPVPSQQGTALPRSRAMAEVAKEHHLLGDLLCATDSNLEVLRRLRGRLRDPGHAGEVNSRWVR